MPPTRKKKAANPPPPAPKPEVKIPEIILRKFPLEVASWRHPGEYTDRKIIFLYKGHYRVNYYNKNRNIFEDTYWVPLKDLHEDVDIDIFRDREKKITRD